MIRYCIFVLCVMTMSGCLVDSSTDPSAFSTSGLESGVSPEQGASASGATRYESVLQRTLIALNGIIKRRLEQFVVDATALHESIDLACDAGGIDQSTQDRWLDAMSTWQQILSVQIGPMVDNGSSLVARVYSWPDQVSTCTVDRQVVMSQLQGISMASAPRQGRGLDALEYLLFSTELEHTCSAFISETENWNQLLLDERIQQRCDYSKQVALDLSSNAQLLLDQWVKFESNLVDIPNSQLYQNADDAINTVTDALFFIDEQVKDRKLGEILGLASAGQCQGVCPEGVESPLSDSGLIHIQNNLIGFKQAFIAAETQAQAISDQLGFDFHLAVRNFPEVAESLLSLTDQAIALSGELDRPLSEYVSEIESQDLFAACINASSNRSSSAGVEVCALHGMIKGITDIMRTDFLTLMSLTLPQRVEGDND